jgi:hypothetical protein
MRIVAPFTDNQVLQLNQWQHDDRVRPFTCPSEGSVLIAACKGWICDQCSYTQNWAYSHMILMANDDLPNTENRTMTKEQKLVVVDLQIKEAELLAQWHMTCATNGNAVAIHTNDKDIAAKSCKHMQEARKEIAKLEKLADKKIKIMAERDDTIDTNIGDMNVE